MGLSLRNFITLLYFGVGFIVEIIVLNLCYFLFSRSHPCHQLSGSISPNIGKLVVCFFFFSHLKGVCFLLNVMLL